VIVVEGIEAGETAVEVVGADVPEGAECR